jgi:hypothetical protein
VNKYSSVDELLSLGLASVSVVPAYELVPACARLSRGRLLTVDGGGLMRMDGRRVRLDCGRLSVSMLGLGVDEYFAL